MTPETPHEYHEVDVDVSPGVVDVDLNPELDSDVPDTPMSNNITVGESGENEMGDHIGNHVGNVRGEDGGDGSDDNEVYENVDVGEIEEAGAEAGAESAVPSVTLPFDDAYEAAIARFSDPQPIGPGQQSKFINYLDEQFLQIQRKFIKNQASAEQTYSLSELLGDLSELLRLLWVSITTRTPLFGQTDYLIKILGDLEDYLFHYKRFFEVQSTEPVISTSEHAKLVQFFTFFQDLDVRISILMDGATGLGESAAHSGDVSRYRGLQFSATERVRMAPIAGRLRLYIVSALEPVRATLQSNMASSSPTLRRSSRHLSDVLDVSMGRLFEGILERS